ncbi:MAG: four helix bundle protein [Alphaproteobacteria bacterium]|nr:four helix bundle protein [Alphaproteobacteria bacterium]
MAKTQDLEIYKRAHTFTLYMYKITRDFPDTEKYGLTTQIRRASGSINANIMEGAARKTNGEYKQFLYIARGSIEELVYHITLAKDLGYISELIGNRCINELSEMGKMLNGLINATK